MPKDTERSTRPPKEWWNKTMKEVKKTSKYEGYGEERLSSIVGGIWADLSEDKKREIRNRYGKEYGKPKGSSKVFLSKEAAQFKDLFSPKYVAWIKTEIPLMAANNYGVFSSIEMVRANVDKAVKDLAKTIQAAVEPEITRIISSDIDDIVEDLSESVVAGPNLPQMGPSTPAPAPTTEAVPAVEAEPETLSPPPASRRKMAQEMNINTLEDAQTFVNNSGVADWAWGGNASSEGFAEFVYKNFNYIDRTYYEDELVDYLVSVGENPSDYDLTFEVAPETIAPIASKLSKVIKALSANASLTLNEAPEDIYKMKANIDTMLQKAGINSFEAALDNGQYKFIFDSENEAKLAHDVLDSEGFNVRLNESGEVGINREQKEVEGEQLFDEAPQRMGKQAQADNLMGITTIEDAYTFVTNSGIADWEFGGNASLEGFAEFLYANYNTIDRNNYSEELSNYLLSVGENPVDYGLGQQRQGKQAQKFDFEEDALGRAFASSEEQLDSYPDGTGVLCNKTIYTKSGKGGWLDRASGEWLSSKQILDIEGGKVLIDQFGTRMAKKASITKKLAEAFEESERKGDNFDADLSQTETAIDKALSENEDSLDQPEPHIEPRKGTVDFVILDLKRKGTISTISLDFSKGNNTEKEVIEKLKKIGIEIESTTLKDGNALWVIPKNADKFDSDLAESKKNIDKALRDPLDQPKPNIQPRKAALELRPVGSNMTEVETDNVVVLFSYSTPVAYMDKASGQCFRTLEQFSTTTSRHINKWLEGRPAEEVDQSQIEGLVQTANAETYSIEAVEEMNKEETENILSKLIGEAVDLEDFKEVMQDDQELVDKIETKDDMSQHTQVRLKEAGFMEPMVEPGKWVILDGPMGGEAIPYEYVDEGELDALIKEVLVKGTLSLEGTSLQDYTENTEIYDIDIEEGFSAYLSAPGYMDRTENVVFDTEEEAWAFLKETYPEEFEGA